ncbi:uncharacterized protein BDW70DRAFT_154623 [Aspergillus foveolatus]|uniref:uncharacterized protein n=1 Tax=Aspergillus foveolatus TaxID=210207 RepID=UPI003CCD3EC0
MANDVLTADFYNNENKIPDSDQGHDKTCRNCNGEGHFARECLKPCKPRAGMACFNCGRNGMQILLYSAFLLSLSSHTKAECPKPRVFQGPCRICNQEGHPAAECPDRPPDVCRNCQQEGHKTSNCTGNRKFDLNHIPDMLPEQAWELLRKASNDRVLEDFREGLKIYSKAVPNATFADIEVKMRAESFNIYLIAMERQKSDCIILINLQGKLNCTYVQTFVNWPPSIEENIERLNDAGLPYDRQIPKCSNCGEKGNGSRSCKEERVVIERVEVKRPRVDKFACRNCESSEHKVFECPNPRSAEEIECKRCDELGHFAKDCPQASAPRACRNCESEDHIARDCDLPRDASTVTYRKCDEVGHFSRDCLKKKDWSKVRWNSCGEWGHTFKRCPQADFAGNTSSASYNVQDESPANNGGWGSEARAMDGNICSGFAGSWP